MTPSTQPPAAFRPGYQFASDNTTGMSPAAWAAIERANADSVASYGDDPWTTRACDLIRELFEYPADIFFVFNGTAANSLALAAMCQSYHAILCHDLAHIETDECGAPEFFSNGTKLLLLSGPHGKLTPEGIAHAVERRRDIHYPKPRVVSVTQATELSTVYSIADLARISEACNRHNLRLHMDGARFANAVAALGVQPKQITWQVGVDVLCLGGTKNGVGIGEAVVFFRKELAEEFAYRCKQAGQLASKMRYLTAPWVGLLEGGAWLTNAQLANAAAARLEKGFTTIPAIEVLGTRQANAVFVKMPTALAAGLRGRGWCFYDFIGSGGCRFMCSWATTDADIDAVLSDAREIALTVSSAPGSPG
ncbi:MAG: low specificity L-threonine aldolase [Planctomycetia bacterium]|nr:low specificity L-threonine aldolase [Planctomycetia bacterium]